MRFRVSAMNFCCFSVMRGKSGMDISEATKASAFGHRPAL